MDRNTTHFEGSFGELSWVHRSEAPPSTNQYLELTDIALREKKAVLSGAKIDPQCTRVNPTASRI